MASDANFIEYIVDLLSGVDGIQYRKMFGEYAIYLGPKVVAMVCDNRLLVKPTEAGRTFIENVVEEPPYPGAKPCFLIEDRIDDREWLCELIRITEQELPIPKLKKKKGK